MHSSIVDDVLKQIAADNSPDFFIKANTEALLSLPGRKVLLDLVAAGGKDALSEENIAAYYHKMNKLSMENLPQTELFFKENDVVPGYEGALKVFESHGKAGERWKFADDSINEFFIKACEIVCKAFDHRFEMNDLYHGHLIYIQSLKDLGIVFHAKEAPQDKIVRETDANVEKLWNKGPLFDYKETNLRNVIYLLSSNKMVAYCNDYSKKEDSYEKFDDAATIGKQFALELAKERISDFSDETVDSLYKKIYAARAIKEEVLSSSKDNSMGDFNIWREAGLGQIELWMTATKDIKLFEMDTLFYLLTNKSAQDIYTRKIKDLLSTPVSPGQSLNTYNIFNSAPATARSEEKHIELKLD
jgi:hypothetical protein